ncbi:hypothetical protein D3C72_1853830 [compost metagenome]
MVAPLQHADVAHDRLAVDQQRQDAQRLVVVPARAPQQRYHGHPHLLAHQLDQCLDGVQLKELVDLQVRAAQRALHQHAGALAAVEAQVGVLRKRLARIMTGTAACRDRHQRLLVQRRPAQRAGHACGALDQDGGIQLAGLDLRRQLDRLGADQAHVERRISALHMRHRM